MAHTKEDDTSRTVETVRSHYPNDLKDRKREVWQCGYEDHRGTGARARYRAWGVSGEVMGGVEGVDGHGRCGVGSYWSICRVHGVALHIQDGETMETKWMNVSRIHTTQS